MFSYPFSRGCGELALHGGSGKQSFQTKGSREGVCIYIYTYIRCTGPRNLTLLILAVVNVLLLSLARFDWRALSALV